LYFSGLFYTQKIKNELMFFIEEAYRAIKIGLIQEVQSRINQ